jgi:hypothetical protein
MVTVKSVLTLLSVLNRPHYGYDLLVRRGSAGQAPGGKYWQTRIYLMSPFLKLAMIDRPLIMTTASNGMGLGP